MSTRFVLTGCVSLFCVVSSLMGQAVEYEPVVGKAHFDFEMPSIVDGKPIQLSGYRGKKVLLMHFASW